MADSLLTHCGLDDCVSLAGKRFRFVFTTASRLAVRTSRFLSCVPFPDCSPLQSLQLRICGAVPSLHDVSMYRCLLKQGPFYFLFFTVIPVVRLCSQQ